MDADDTDEAAEDGDLVDRAPDWLLSRDEDDKIGWLDRLLSFVFRFLP